MLHNWVYEDDLPAFIQLLAIFAEYELLKDEEDAILLGAKSTDSDKENWYEYRFEGKTTMHLALAQDPGSSVIFFKISTNAEIEDKAATALLVLNHLRQAGKKA